MAVEDTNKIDFISIDRESGRCILTIADAMEWSANSSKNHVLLLQEKLNSYLRFLESREVELAYPESVGRERVINIKFMNQPDGYGVHFLRTARAIVEEAGFSLLLDGPDGPW